MNDLSSDTVGMLRRELRDTRALAANIDHKLRKLIEPAPARLRPRDHLVRAAVVRLIAKETKQSFDDILAQRFHGDAVTPLILQRAAMSPAITTGAGWAAELAGTAVADFFSSLPAGAYAQLIARTPLRIDIGRNASIRLPAPVTPADAAQGGFVGEGAPIKISKRSITAAVTLTPKKFVIASEVTKEMVQYSAIEQVLRMLLQESAMVAIDVALLGNAAATSAQPAGLLNGLSSLTPSTATTVEDRMSADLGALAAAIPGALDVVYVVPLAERLVIEGLGTSELLQRVIVSPVMPAKRIVAIDVSQFASLTGDAAEIDVTEVAAIHEEDTTPLPIVGGTAQPPVIGSVAAPVRSLWQTGSMGVRLIASLSWAMRLGSRVSFVDAVTW
jgi:hypothetical protein